MILALDLGSTRISPSRGEPHLEQVLKGLALHGLR